MIRDSERASPPTAAGNALVATWQRSGHRRRCSCLRFWRKVGSSCAALPEWRPAGRLATLHPIAGATVDRCSAQAASLPRRPAPPALVLDLEAQLVSRRARRYY